MYFCCDRLKFAGTVLCYLMYIYSIFTLYSPFKKYTFESFFRHQLNVTSLCFAHFQCDGNFALSVNILV